MGPIQFIVNGKELLIGDQIPKEVTNLSIIHMNTRLKTDPQTTTIIKQWLNQLASSLTKDSVIIHNGIILNKDEIKLFDLKD